MSRLPDFIIPGAAKAGTTSLVAYLRQHTRIFLPQGTGEVHFFNNDKNYSNGIEWYKNHFKNAKDNQLVGEKTPRYSELFVPQRMVKYLPDVKLIWIFRNPVDRAYSHYNMYIWNGVENLSFEEALEKKEERVKNGHNMYNYKSLGKYSIYVKEYLKYYDIKNMMFIVFEDFINDTKNVMNKVTQFLGIEVHDNYIDEHKLKFISPINSKYQIIIRNLLYGRNNSGNSIFPLRIRKPAFNILTYLNRSRKKYPMDKSTREQLINFYRPYNKELENLTGIQVLKQWDK